VDYITFACACKNSHTVFIFPKNKNKWKIKVSEFGLKLNEAMKEL
jgi:hypothetical protein